MPSEPPKSLQIDAAGRHPVGINGPGTRGGYHGDSTTFARCRWDVLSRRFALVYVTERAHDADAFEQRAVGRTP